MRRQERGELEAKVQFLREKYNLKHDVPAQPYRSYLVRFYEQYPEEFERFATEPKDSILRSMFVNRFAETGVPPAFYEALYRFRFGKQKREERSKEMREYSKRMWERLKDLKAVSTALMNEFGIGYYYATRIVREVIREA